MDTTGNYHGRTFFFFFSHVSRRLSRYHLLALVSSNKLWPSFVTYFGHNHAQDIPVTAIDPFGTLVIRLYQNAISVTNDARLRRFLRADGVKIDGIIVAQFQVSAAVMVQSYAAFEEIYQANQWSDSDAWYIDLDYSNPLPIGLVLRVLHESGPLSKQFHLVTLAQVEQIIGIIHAFRCPKERFRQWFFECTPVGTWSDFYALMTSHDIQHLLPKPRNKGPDSDWEVLRKTSYLNWANSVDQKVRWVDKRDGMRFETTVWSREMEGAWVRNAVGVFVREVERLGDVFWEKEAVREGLQWALRKIVEKKGEGMPRELWMKKTARMEEITEMKAVEKVKRGGEGDGMDGLLRIMEDLQVEAANKADPEEMTAEEAMVVAMERIDCGADFKLPVQISIPIKQSRQSVIDRHSHDPGWRSAVVALLSALEIKYTGASDN
ncbi:hypothetical protein BKA64DRAFT_715603 [Cadophora sp. MPI-SDFR-AT-0126]|nr:hypothetical protein BKA64DRAFT_715603 [Leotiomycetes sp. MPI-SDFR-AT-0126]